MKTKGPARPISIAAQKPGAGGAPRLSDDGPGVHEGPRAPGDDDAFQARRATLPESTEARSPLGLQAPVSGPVQGTEGASASPSSPRGAPSRGELNAGQTAFVESLLTKWKQDMRSPGEARRSTEKAVFEIAQFDFDAMAKGGDRSASAEAGSIANMASLNSDTRRLAYSHLFEGMVQEIADRGDDLDRGCIAYTLSYLINEAVAVAPSQGESNTIFLGRLFQLACDLRVVDQIVGPPPVEGDLGEWSNGRASARLLGLVQKTGLPVPLKEFYEGYERSLKQCSRERLAELKEILQPYRQEVGRIQGGFRLAALTQQWGESIQAAVDRTRSQEREDRFEGVTDAVSQCLKEARNDTSPITQRLAARRDVPYALVQEHLLRVFESAQRGEVSGQDVETVVASLLRAFDTDPLYGGKRRRVDNREIQCVIRLLETLLEVVAPLTRAPEKRTPEESGDRDLRWHILRGATPASERWLGQIKDWHRAEVSNASSLDSLPAETSSGLDSEELRSLEVIEETLIRARASSVAPVTGVHGDRRAIVDGIVSLIDRHAGVESALRGRGLTRARRGELREVRQNLRRALNFKDGQLQAVALDDVRVEEGAPRMAAYLDDCEELARAWLKVVYGLDPNGQSPREEALADFFAAFERDNPVGMFGARQFSRPSPQLLYCSGVHKTLQLFEDGASSGEIRKRLENIVGSGNAEAASGPLGSGADMSGLLSRAFAFGEEVYPRLKFGAKVQRVMAGLNSEDGGDVVLVEKDRARAEERLLRVFEHLEGLRFTGNHGEEMAVIKELVESCSVREGMPGADEILPVLVEVIKVDSEGAARLRKIVKASGDEGAGTGIVAYLLSTVEVALGQAALELKKEK